MVVPLPSVPPSERAAVQLVHHGRTGLLCRRLELDVAEDSTGEASQRYPVLVRLWSLCMACTLLLLSCTPTLRLVNHLSDACAALNALGCLQPRVIHINAVSDVIENVTFMWCPPERLVEVEVPITVSALLMAQQKANGQRWMCVLRSG